MNESPWGDDSALMPRAPQRRPREPRQQELFDVDGTMETSYLGDRAKTTLLEQDPDEVDEDPFVDLSSQLEAERAETTLIPIEDRYVDGATAAALGSDAAQADEAAGVGEQPAHDSASDQAAERALVIPEFLRHPRSEREGALETAEAAAEAPEPAAPQPRETPKPAPRPAAASAEDGSERLLPPVSMLRHSPQAKAGASSSKELQQTAESLQSTLQEFGLHSRVVGWISGPHGHDVQGPAG